MANLTYERVGELMACVFQLLWNRPDGLPAREIIGRIPDILHLTESERGWVTATNTIRYERIVRLSSMPLVKAGWLVKNEKGRWYLTESGREASRRFSDAQAMYAEALRLSKTGAGNTSEILMSLEIIQEKSWQYIEQYLQGRKPIEMRRLIADLLEALDYHILWLAPPEKVHGQIDMVVNADPLGSKPSRILVQVKHKGQVTTLEGVKSFISVLGPDDFGLLMSSGGFTRDVRSQLTSPNYARLNAMDLEKFFNLWVRNFSNLSADAKMRFPLQPIYFISPNAE